MIVFERTKESVFISFFFIAEKNTDIKIFKQIFIVSQSALTLILHVCTLRISHFTKISLGFIEIHRRRDERRYVYDLVSLLFLLLTACLTECEKNVSWGIKNELQQTSAALQSTDCELEFDSFDYYATG